MVLHATNHSGYMAVGFSENGGMKGADVIVAYPGFEGSCVVLHHYFD